MNFILDMSPIIFLYVMVYAYALALAWNGSKMSFAVPAVLWVVEVLTNLFFPPSVPKLSQLMDILVGETFKLATFAALLYFVGVPVFQALSEKKTKNEDQAQPQKS
jgi:hypothetical protein